MTKLNVSGWHTLPVELHRRIVSHAALPWKDDGHPGRDLLSLRLVNRELAEIAPEWIYETVELAKPFLDTLLGLVETILAKYGRYVKRLDFTHSSGLRQEIERRARRRDFPEDACAGFASQPVPTECQVAIASARAALEKLDSDPTYLFSGLLSGYGLVAAAIRLCPKTAAIRIIDSDEPFGIRMVSVGPDVVTQHDEFGLEETYTTSFPPFRALLDQGPSLTDIEIRSHRPDFPIWWSSKLYQCSPNLKRLTIPSKPYAFDDADTGPPFEMLTGVPTLRLHLRDAHARLSGILDSPQSQPFRKLVLGAQGSNLLTVRRFLTVHADNVLDLVLENAPGGPMGASISLPNLRALTIVQSAERPIVLFWPSTFRDSPVSTLAFDCRRAHPTCRIEEDGIHIERPSDSVITAAGWFAKTLVKLNMRLQAGEMARVEQWGQANGIECGRLGQYAY